MDELEKAIKNRQKFMGKLEKLGIDLLSQHIKASEKSFEKIEVEFDKHKKQLEELYDRYHGEDDSKRELIKNFLDFHKKGVLEESK